MRRALAMARHETRQIISDPAQVIIMIAMPLTSMAIFKGSMRGALQATGWDSVNGSEQVVPGFLMLSAFFMPTFIGLTFVKEHGWYTWDRLQSTPLRPWELIVGKTLPWFIVGVVQVFSVFLIASLVFGLES